MRHLSQAAQRGFTLIEIMVVIVILGVLAALVVPKVMSRPDEARAVAAKQDLGALSQALKLYRLDNGRYPSSDQGLQALVQKPSSAPEPKNWKPGGYLERLPRTRGAIPTSTRIQAPTARSTSGASVPTANRAARAWTPTSATGT